MDTSKIYILPLCFYLVLSYLVFIILQLTIYTVPLRLLLVRIYALSIVFTVPISIPQISLKIGLWIGISESSSITFGDDRDKDLDLGSNL